MTDPIVSPWLIYLLGQMNNFQVLAQVLATVSGILAVVFTVIAIGSHLDEYVSDAATQVWKKLSIISVPVAVFLIVVGVLCPNRDTVIAMCVANEVTPQAITKTVDVGKDLHTGLGKMKDELVGDIIKILNASQQKATEE